MTATQVGLDQLESELEQRGWTTRRMAGKLRAINPEAGELNEDIVFDGVSFCWAWGPVIGPADDVGAVADRVLHVLRTVSDGAGA